MLRALAHGLLVSALLISVSAADSDRCNCEEEGFWGIENILECQRVSDFLIAVAYFSIPIELIYFISCSNVPFKWVLVEFIAFIVLCGMTHLLNGWTYGPHAFQLTLAVTIFKFLTALVSCATAITLLTLFPLLLKVKVREFMLKKKAWDLDREVGIIKKQREAGWQVRMLTQEIRKSLDRHTILYRTLVELSKRLDLQNCAVWMPNENRTEMILTHDLKERNPPNSYNRSIPYSDPDVRNIKESEGVKILRPDSALGCASSGRLVLPGAVAAIRMPMLRVSNFKGGTPEMIKTCYALLVLVLPSGQDRTWTSQELEIIKVVADQVTVAISHAAVLEESQHMREKLVEQNRALQQARKNAMMASQARNSFQKVMSNGMRKPMHSILGLLSVLQEDNFSTNQRLIVDTMMKTSNVLSVLINDVMDDSPKVGGRFPSEVRSFGLHALIKEAGCVARCLCVDKGFDFSMEVERSLPDQVRGDERRVFQVILHMVGNLLDNNKGGEKLTFHVFLQRETEGRNNQRWAAWKSSGSSDGYLYIRFEAGITVDDFLTHDSILTSQLNGQRRTSEAFEGDLSFNICQKLVRLMQGSIWVVPNPRGFPQSMALVLRFQLQPSVGIAISESNESSEQLHHNSIFKGLRVLLVDDDDMNRTVTRKMLEKLACTVTAVSSGFECLNAVGPSGSSHQIIMLDLHLHHLDGFEVATRIRRFCGHSWPLIIALTSNADENVWVRIKQAGMNGVIQKPILLPGLVDELSRFLLQSN
ncbi:Enoyl-[acyl-carrier-protein] reductase [NADPH, B-specific] 2, mitochondrial [Ancistrocladus abbreviatus]